MKIFLVTDEFIAGTVNPSFRAVVIAADESGARWVVARQKAGPGMENVRQACAISLGETEVGEETVLSYTTGIGTGSMVKTHPPIPLEADEFYRVSVETVRDPLAPLPQHPDRLGDNQVSYWFSQHTGIMMRLTERETVLPNLTGEKGVYSEKESYAQYWRLSHNAKRPEFSPTESLNVEHYLARPESANIYTLAETHSIISRLSQAPYHAEAPRELLSYLWDNFVSYKEVGSDTLVKDLLLFNGQQLWFQAEKARDWFITVPQCITLVRNLNTDA
ncbi:hypothetical protein STRATTON_257 [Erwinia phage vB_EamM_Stratton]|uniref:Uncharacterized protein n=2 Tax=Erskinevirus EaH2 TaxID=2169883 RepID=A0A1B2IHG7_9CAUD|nr:hypothetical protein G173_gp155 [Erwinia phage phiEaH2]AFQ96700.1 hypothetical protein [Erwinia phage phiEaH2]ANZ50682.1 hypothetical protein STRATTON_257 [Erwinia phage vB_EamM_Stratton]